MSGPSPPPCIVREEEGGCNCRASNPRGEGVGCCASYLPCTMIWAAAVAVCGEGGEAGAGVCRRGCG